MNLNLDPQYDDVSERMQEVGRMIATILPPGTGFALLAFDYTPGSKLHYISTAKRETIVAAMTQWIQQTDGGRFAKHLANVGEEAVSMDLKQEVWRLKALLEERTEERNKAVAALKKIQNYRVGDEPVFGAQAMQDIAEAALENAS